MFPFLSIQDPTSNHISRLVFPGPRQTRNAQDSNIAQMTSNGGENKEARQEQAIRVTLGFTTF